MSKVFAARPAGTPRRLNNSSEAVRTSNLRRPGYIYGGSPLKKKKKKERARLIAPICGKALKSVKVSAYRRAPTPHTYVYTVVHARCAGNPTGLYGALPEEHVLPFHGVVTDVQL